MGKNLKVTSDISSLYQGEFDASVGAYPTVGTLTDDGVEAGNWWVISVAGTLGIYNLAPGDLLIAKISNPETDSDWTYIKKEMLQVIAEHYVQLDAAYHLKDGDVRNGVGDRMDHKFSSSEFKSEIVRSDQTTLISLADALIQMALTSISNDRNHSVKLNDDFSIEIYNNAKTIGTFIKALKAGNFSAQVKATDKQQDIQLTPDKLEYSGMVTVGSDVFQSKISSGKNGFDISWKNDNTLEGIKVTQVTNGNFIIEKSYLNDSNELKVSKVRVGSNGQITFESEENLAPKMGSAYPVTDPEHIVHNQHLTQMLNTVANGESGTVVISNGSEQEVLLPYDRLERIFEIFWTSTRGIERNSGKLLVGYDSFTNMANIFENISMYPAKDCGIEFSVIVETSVINLVCKTNPSKSGITDDIELTYNIKTIL